MGTTGGKRVPIDARLKDLFEAEPLYVGENGVKGSPRYKKVSGYTVHFTTCPRKAEKKP